MSQPPTGPDPYGPSGGPGQPPAQGGWGAQPPQPGPHGAPGQGEPDCIGSQGVGEWSGAGSSGQLACALIDGRPWLHWTGDVAPTEGIVVGGGSTQADHAALHEWWTTNSDYVR